MATLCDVSSSVSLRFLSSSSSSAAAALAMRFASSSAKLPQAAAATPPSSSATPPGLRPEKDPGASNPGIAPENGCPPPSSPSSSPSFSVYCLLSADMCRTYVGVTSDLHRRIRQHNGELAGGAKASRSGRPWKIICTVKGFPTYSEASKFEWKWKDASKTMHVKRPSVQEETAPGNSSLLDAPLVDKRKKALDQICRSKDWECLSITWHLGHGNS